MRMRIRLPKSPKGSVSQKRAEAKSSSANDPVLVSREFIVDPRHIDLQVLGDSRPT